MAELSQSCILVLKNRCVFVLFFTRLQKKKKVLFFLQSLTFEHRAADLSPFVCSSWHFCTGLIFFLIPEVATWYCLRTKNVVCWHAQIWTARKVGQKCSQPAGQLRLNNVRFSLGFLHLFSLQGLWVTNYVLDGCIPDAGLMALCVIQFSLQD